MREIWESSWRCGRKSCSPQSLLPSTTLGCCRCSASAYNQVDSQEDQDGLVAPPTTVNSQLAVPNAWLLLPMQHFLTTR